MLSQFAQLLAYGVSVTDQHWHMDVQINRTQTRMDAETQGHHRVVQPHLTGRRRTASLSRIAVGSSSSLAGNHSIIESQLPQH